MRDPARIARIAAKLTTLWNVYPDMRLAQLVENINRQSVTHTNTFNLEDDILEARIDSILSTGKF